jgi:hypothetical protein
MLIHERAGANKIENAEEEELQLWVERAVDLGELR